MQQGGMRRRVSVFLFAAAAFGIAHARTVSVGPEACFMSANAGVYQAPFDIEAKDINPDRSVAEDALVIFDVPLRDGWASRHLFARLAFDADVYRVLPLLPCNGR
jgi:hypothetical protein